MNKPETDQTQLLQDTVAQAFANKRALCIVGSNSKHFYGNPCQGEPVSTLGHTGVVAYEPSELVITVRCGTRIRDIEALLAQHQQMLPFEPPHFGPDATIGGAIACGFSGPRRPFAGAARDAMLGCKIINGKGEVLSFGGQVMKNVAGYDVSRLMVGAMGTLGVLLEVSLKVLPRPPVEISLAHTLSVQEALDVMCARAAKPLPLSAAHYDGESVILRLSGTEVAVNAARKRIFGDVLESGTDYWHSINEQTHYFFEASVQGQAPLWRLSLAPGSLPLALDGQWLFDWVGGLRWLVSDMPADQIRAAVEAEGGHATLFRGRDLFCASSDDSDADNSSDKGVNKYDVFHPLPPHLLTLHKNLKRAFDPGAILNPGRFHANID